MKKCIYTCVTGEYDKIDPPQCVTPGWDYICFTDKSEAPGWEIREFDATMSNVKKARYFKTLMPELDNYDLTIWIDGNFSIRKDLNDFVSTYHKEGMFTVMRHPVRKCFVEEAIACLNRGKDVPRLIMEQVLHYAAEGYPRGNGLLASGIIIRENNEITKKINQKWWEQIEIFSGRDQISFGYVIWKLGLEKYINYCDYNYLSEVYFVYNEHQQKQEGEAVFFGGERIFRKK